MYQEQDEFSIAAEDTNGDVPVFRRVWRQPMLTRVELKRTMDTVGSGNDGYSSTGI